MTWTVLIPASSIISLAMVFELCARTTKRTRESSKRFEDSVRRLRIANVLVAAASMMAVILFPSTLGVHFAASLTPLFLIGALVSAWIRERRASPPPSASRFSASIGEEPGVFAFVDLRL